jgi:hypothetical protein
MREMSNPVPFGLPAGRITLLAFFLSVAACTGPEGYERTVEVVDSAGITIVQNRGSLNPTQSPWEITPTPETSIGTFDGDSLQQLYGVQGALRLRDGKIAVANAGSGQIRLFRPDGHFLRALGRPGEGPGEFRQPIMAGVLGRDTLVVVDATLRRLTYLHVEEGYLFSAGMAENVGGGVYPVGLLPTGDVVVGGGIVFGSDAGQQITGGYSRQITTYRSVARDGNLSTDFGEFPGAEMFMEIKNQAGAMSMMARGVPFGKHPMAAVGRGGFFFGSGDEWEIQLYSPEGELKRIIRLDRERRPVGNQDLENFIAAQVDEVGDPSEVQALRNLYADMPIPDFMPVFERLVTDSRGDLWVERFRAPGNSTPEFDILDSQGRIMGWARLPEEAVVLDIGEDYVLALYRDDLGVEYVKQYHLDRPMGS